MSCECGIGLCICDELDYEDWINEPTYENYDSWSERRRNERENRELYGEDFDQGWGAAA